MRNKPIIQKKKISKDDNNYGESWDGLVGMMINEKYTNVGNFINAYGNDPKKVFKDLNTEYQIIPFDFKETLQKIYGKNTIKGVA